MRFETNRNLPTLRSVRLCLRGSECWDSDGTIVDTQNDPREAGTRHSDYIGLVWGLGNQRRCPVLVNSWYREKAANIIV
jgi:hypothetical protein